MFEVLAISLEFQFVKAVAIHWVNILQKTWLEKSRGAKEF